MTSLKLALFLFAFVFPTERVLVHASAPVSSSTNAVNTPLNRRDDIKDINKSPTSDTPEDTNKKRINTADPPPLRICILCEPSPLTYLSGQAGRFTALMEHLANAEDYRLPLKDNDTDLENSYLHLVTAEKAHPSPPTTYQPSKTIDCNATSTPTIPVHYTQGLVLPNYAGLTVCADWTCKVLRLLFPRKNRKFDLLHVSTPGFLVYPAILASRVYQIPLVMSYHTHIPVYFRSYFPLAASFMEWVGWCLVRTGHAFADLTLLTSPQMKEQFASQKIARCHVWPKGIDTQRFHPKYKSASMRRRMTEDNDDCVLLVYIGRLAREKRLEDLKELLEKLNGSDNAQNYRLCIVGTGPQEASLKEYFANTPTTFLGRLDGQELSQAFASGDVFVMPSDSETLGFVVLESMASGVPCVAANAGGLVDIIQHNRSGLLAEPGNMDEFAECVVALQKDAQLRQRLAETGRRETEQWSWDSSMKHVHEEIYQEAQRNFAKRPVQRFLCWSRAFFRRSVVSE